MKGGGRDTGLYYSAGDTTELTMANTQPNTCSKCGTKAQGEFCSGCGARLDQASCRACGASIAPAVRFCHVCGAPQVSETRPSPQVLPWIIAGSALVILVLVLVVRIPSSDPVQSPAQGITTSGTPIAPDISNMTPREQADRLFDRVIIAAEQGDTTQELQFASKTVTAYGMLGALDEDARYHLGLVHDLQGDPIAAALQADSIEANVPRHLFANLIRYRTARSTRDTSGMLGAYGRFLESYDSEIAADRAEYELHRNTIDAFHNEARRATASKR